MIKLTIVKKDTYVYELEDEMENKYEKNLEFIDIEEQPSVGDVLYFNSELLNPNYEGHSYVYVFGPLDSKYGRANLEEDSIDRIKLEVNGKTLHLKRLFG